MTKNLLVVESPAKARTLMKYLGPGFKVVASVGHVKDLPAKRLGVDIENDFKPEYVTIKGKAQVLKNLKAEAQKADAIYLAPDPDREGEAIAWHIAGELDKPGTVIYRVLFNELTARAIREAVAAPQSLNRDKFESQQARRILDRLVGYQISPVLWKKVRKGLSAGRVQSVALRMICEREREIHAFEPQEYWTLTAHLEAGEPPPFKARFLRLDGRKVDLKSQEQTQAVTDGLAGKPFRVVKVSKKDKKKNPPSPFITSLLQQEAFRKLGFSAKKTMSVAQALYEGVQIGERGETGLITYMRTDSFRLSSEAISEVRDHIRQAYGEAYLPEAPNRFRSAKQAQEAHEAIRPTTLELDPEAVAGYLTKDQLALYGVIWKRFIACQMTPALLEQTQAEISAGRATFAASGSVTVFKGFTAVYEENPTDQESEPEREAGLPPLERDQELKLLQLEPAQHFTQPPPRYTEATLIKALEENGIGRPSTYASILANISDREYVSAEKKRFKPTELGFMVSDLLVQGFPDIMDYDFTAQMENDLDRIEQGQLGWVSLLKRFYESFDRELKKAEKQLKGEVPTQHSCPKCSRTLAIKSGRNGLFLACTGYPECRYTANFHRDAGGRIVMEETPETGEKAGVCDLCGRDMVNKQGRFGPFLACTGYPECRNTRKLEKPADGPGATGEPVTGARCPVCGADMVVRTSRAGHRFLSCSTYPKCTHAESLKTDVPCPEEGCDGTLVERASKKGRRFYSCNRYPKCRFAMWEEPFDEKCPECGTPVLAVKRRKGGEAALSCRKKGCGFTRPYPAPAAESASGENA